MAKQRGRHTKPKVQIVPTAPAPSHRSAAAILWEHRQMILGAAFLFLIVALAYFPAFSAGYVWDDPDHITNNPLLPRPDGLFYIWFRPSSLPQYYPLVHTAFWVEYRLWGLNPIGYHTDNILLHACSALLLWRLGRRLGVPGALWVAAIFAVHPAQVESVAWVSERKNILSTLFYLCAFWMYLNFDESLAPDSPEHPRRWRIYVLALVLFAGALFSKTVTASLPVAILLVWWWKGRKIVGRDLLLLAPFFLLGIVLGAFTAVLERSHVGAVGKEFDFSFFERVQLAGSALWFYAWKLVWPANLTFVYPKQNWHIGAGDALGYLFPIAAVGVVVGLWALRRRIGRGPLAAVLFFIISLFPALGFFNIYPMRYAFAADHYQYLACIGLIALAVGILAHLMPKLADNAFPLRLGAGHAVMGALLVVLIYLSAHHAGAFESSEALWRDTLTKNTTSWMVPTNLAHTYFIDGRAYEEAGRGDVANQYYEQAMLNYQRALQLAPGLPETHFNLGELLAQRGQPDAALQEFRAAVEKNSKFPLAYESMGLTFMRRQEWDRAIENFGRALEFNPALWKSRMNLGVALIRTGKLHEAAEQFQMVTTQVPDLVDAHYRLGDCLAQLGDLAGAIGEYRTVVDLKPDYAEAYLALAKVLYASGNEAEALRSLAEVNRLKPELTRRAEKILATQPATSAPAATTAPAGSTPAVSTPAGSTPAATRP